MLALDRGELVDKSKMVKKPRAKIWAEYWAYSNHPDVARCRHCDKEIQTKDGSTSGMKRHFENVHSNVHRKRMNSERAWQKKNETNSESPNDRTGTSTSTSTSLQKMGFHVVDSDGVMDKKQKTQPSFDVSVLKWLVFNYYRFELVESPEWRAFLRALQRKAPDLSAKEMRSLCLEKVAAFKQKLAQEIKGQDVAISTNTWTTTTNDQFTTITANWISANWVSYSCPINVFRHKEWTIGTVEEQRNQMKGNLDHLKNRRNSLRAIVTKADTATFEFGSSVIEESSKLYGENIDWVPCLDYLLESSINTVYQHSRIQEALKVARIINNQLALDDGLIDALKVQQIIDGVEEENTLSAIMDVNGKWWSVYSAITRLLRLQSAVKVLMNSGKIKYSITNEQWEYLLYFVMVLKPFMTAKKLFTDNQQVSISFVTLIVFQIRKGLVHALKEPNISELFSNLVTNVLNSFNSIWGTGETNTVFDEHMKIVQGQLPRGFRRSHMLGAALDPRTKNLAGFSSEDQEKIFSLLKTEAIRVLSASSDENKQVKLDTKETNRFVAEDEEIMTDIFQMLRGSEEGDGVDDEGNPVVSKEEIIEKEVISYRNIRVLELKDTENNWNNPLEWWSKHKLLYPNLSTVAKRVLCIPATSATISEIFTESGLNSTVQRAEAITESVCNMAFLCGAWPYMDAINTGVTK